MNWQQSTSIYNSRVSMLGATSLNIFGDVINQLPCAPLSYTPSHEGLLKYQLCLLVIAAARSAQELGQAIQLLWVSGRFLAGSLAVRLLLEERGFLAYAKTKVLRKIDEAGELKIAHERLTKLLLGSKSGVPLPAGLGRHHAVINVNEFIREAELLSPGTADAYAFLCDASHPTYLQHSYLLFAGADYDNWSNAKFSETAHSILERTLSIAEGALLGVKETGLEIFNGCLPMILSEAAALYGAAST